MIQFDRTTIRLGNVKVVESLTLDVTAGEPLALIGRTGSGKSTLLAALATAIPLAGGEISVDGHPVSRDPAAVRRLIGYVPASLPAWPSARIDEFLDLFAAASGLSGRPRRLAVERAITFAGLAAAGTKRVDSLSEGGMKRLLVARGLLHDPRVLVLDDPFAGLDPAGRTDLEQLIADTAIMGRTVIAAIADAAVPECFQRLAVLESGRITYSGPASPDAIRPLRRWRQRIICPGQADTAADTLRAVAEEVRLVDANTVDCRVDPAQVDAAPLVAILVRSGIRVVSAGFHPHWAAQLIED